MTTAASCGQLGQPSDSDGWPGRCPPCCPERGCVPLVDALLASPVLADIKSKGEANEFAYSRYDAIGLFRMLELGGATEPAALEKLADAAGLQLKKVNGDLSMYKGLLSKLAAAKELQKEIFEREKRKTAERLAKKEAANDATA